MGMTYKNDGTVHITWDNGTVYDGQYIGNTVTGKGFMSYKGGRYTYDGYFKNYTWDGYGKAIWYKDDGTIMSSTEGQWINNKRCGHIIQCYYFDNELSQIDKGEWSEDIQHGHLVKKWIIGPVELAGQFENQIPVGSIHATYGPDYHNEIMQNTVYDGAMVYENNCYYRHGQGRYVTADGTVYEGSFIHSKRNGVFKISYPDGSQKVVDIKDDVIVSTIFHKDKFGNEIKTEKQNFEKVQEDELVDTNDGFLHVSRNDNSMYSSALLDDFKSVVGMHNVKKQLDTMYKRFKIDSMRQITLGLSANKQGYYFIITGNPGTGKTTVARIIGKMLYNMSLLPSNVFVEVDRSKLVGQYIGQTAQLTTEVINSARGGTLFIDEAYTLYKKDNDRDFGVEAIDTLLKDMEDHRGEYCVIMAGYEDQMNNMIRNANPGLASRFDHKINIEDYSADELVDILVSMAESRSFHIKKEARDIILARINKEKIDETFDNARFARRLLDEAIEKQALRLSENIDNLDMADLQVLKGEDFGTLETNLSTLDSTLEKLNNLTGLGSVKAEVNSLVKAIKIQNESRKRGLAIANNSIPMNMVFTGNPGTGKTTVARLLSQIYFHLGLLKRPDVFVECVRADLVGRYQGETALKVKEVIRRSLGGVLFIDEAYSLVMDERDSFGVEAVNTLVSEIENNRDNLAVIMAGYTKEMNEFLDTNPGLRSRLSRIIEFPDYSVDELLQIFHFDMTRRGYKVECSDDLVKAMIETDMQKKDFGNARGVRNICDRIINNHNDRINNLDLSALTNEEIVTINDQDIK